VLPEINIDAFRICIYERWKLGELIFTNLVIAFGKSSIFNLRYDLTPCHGVIDFFTFLVILTSTRRRETSRFPGIPSILDAILRDATVYYALVFVCQLVFEFFLLFAPVREDTI
jgi:hypothetical protein